MLAEHGAHPAHFARDAGLACATMVATNAKGRIMQRETPQLKNIEQVSEGWVNKYVLTYVLPDGTDYQYEAVSRKGLDAYRAELERLGKRSDAAIAAVDAGAEDFGASVLEEAEGVANLAEKRVADAVSIVPVTRRNELVLIREFRYPLNSWVVGLPAGLVEPGESYADAVDRELREETGYRLRSDIPKPAAIDPLPQSGRSSTGMSDESVLTVFAQVEKDEEQHTERGELIEVFTLHLRDVQRFLKQNQLPLGTRLQLVLEMFARSTDF